jgi:hypothetical protein
LGRPDPAGGDLRRLGGCRAWSIASNTWSIRDISEHETHSPLSRRNASHADRSGMPFGPRCARTASASHPALGCCSFFCVAGSHGLRPVAPTQVGTVCIPRMLGWPDPGRACLRPTGVLGLWACRPGSCCQSLHRLLGTTPIVQLLRRTAALIATPIPKTPRIPP